MIGEITIIPQAEQSKGQALSEAIRALGRSGVRYQASASGASVEGELDAICTAVRAIDARLRGHGVERAVLELRVQLEPPSDRGEQLTLAAPAREEKLLVAQEHKGYGYDEGERIASLRS